jgi:hypothetical protein
MDSLEFDAQFAGKPVHIEVSAPRGAGNSYQVMINKYYNGSLTKTTNYDWQIHLHPNTILTGDDVSIIIDLIEQNLMMLNNKKPGAAYM